MAELAQSRGEATVASRGRGGVTRGEVSAEKSVERRNREGLPPVNDEPAEL